MAKPKMFEKPIGVKDYLPDAAAKLRHLEQQVTACMSRWGYSQILTPTLEFYDTVGAASATEDRKLFKLLDRNGTTVVLRSDMTAPIARVVSSLLKDEPLPFRLSYHTPIFRAYEEKGARDAEFFQTGVELVGDASPDADAEIISLAASSLESVGISSFTLALGHVGYLNCLFEETLGDQKAGQEELKQCLLDRNYVRYREQIHSFGLSEETITRLEAVLTLRGDREILQKARKTAGSSAAREAVDELEEIWDVLEAYEVTPHVVIDLTMVMDFSYYTGMTFEGYAADLGFPVCSGGRYDHLMGQFGRQAPSTGFSLKTSRILDFVEEPSQPKRVLVLYTRENRKKALQYVQKRRMEEHIIVETRLIIDEESELEKSGLKINGPSYQRTGYNEILTWIGDKETGREERV
jgi:ATP phosphoribosyltransferase regulatory subunit